VRHSGRARGAAGALALGLALGPGLGARAAGAEPGEAARARAAPIAIAHRGASGHLPEHTLAAYALAILQGADFIEPDLVITRDGVLIARHDNELGATTDVAAHPELASRRRSKRVDGRELTGWFSEDLSLAELRRLRAVERIPELRPQSRRFDGDFGVPTFEEVVRLARSLEPVVGRPIGLYPETKHPGHFRALGLPLEPELVRILHEHGYRGPEARVFLQSFEPTSLRALARLTQLPRAQLLAPRGAPPDTAAAGGARSYAEMATPAGLAEIARHAQVVGVEKGMLLAPDAAGALHSERATPLVRDAHAAGLLVHVYTFREENAFLPASLRRGGDPAAPGELERELRSFLALGIDGFFCDQPAAAVRARDAFRAQR